MFVAEIKYLFTRMVELVESAAERKERKRLKKLRKAAAAQQHSGSLSDDSPLGSDIDSVSKTLSGETPEQKKERKRLKKLAKQSLEKAVETIEKEEKIKKKEKKEKKKVVDNSGDINSNEKSAKKRKLVDDSVKENSSPEKPVNAWTKMMMKKKSEEEPVAKKPKKNEVKLNVDTYEEKETGVFKKIFYKATETTINLAEEVVKNFRAENKMNVTGDNVDHYKPILQFSDFCQDPATMSVCKVRKYFSYQLY